MDLRIRAEQLPEIAATRRPVCRFTLERRDVPPWASKVGGAPYLPPEAAIPTDSNGTSMWLLAQINFADLGGMPGYPTEGLVQFFIAGDDLFGMDLDDQVAQRGFRVVYWPRVEQDSSWCGAAAVAPDELLPHDASTTYAMCFERGAETISSSDSGFEPISSAVTEALQTATGLTGNDLEDAIYETLTGAGHKVGGYPYFTQYDPRTAESPLRLLLQIDSDDGAGIMWGDAGVAGFFIDPVDLERGDFSRVLYNWDCG